MRGRGVDDARCRIVDQGDGFAGGIVGQAQDNDIGGVEGVAARARIFAPGVVKLEQIELGAARQPGLDFKSGCARRAVNEDACHVRSSADAAT